MSKSRILVIDDDRDVCKVLGDNLAEDGYETATALTGAEGIEKAKNGRFDLIILDLKLPDQSGVDVLKRIRGYDKDALIVILTGYPSLETAIETLKNSAADYILKPFNVSHLRGVVQRELANKREKAAMDLTEVREVGERIRKLRKNRGMSLGALAEKSTLSKSYLSELERKKKSPGIDTLMSISQELNVSVYFFFKDKGQAQ
jgi:DNA-binding response OmpR family regulator